MKRILLVLTVALVMAAMLVVMVAPAFSAPHSNPNIAGTGTGETAKTNKAQPVTPPQGSPF